MASNGGGGGAAGQCIISNESNGSLECCRLYHSRRTVFEMLRDRGYDVDDSEIDRTFSEFCSVFGDNPELDRLRICVSLRSNRSKKILVIFCGKDEIRKANICAIYAQIVNKESLHRLLLVVQNKMNSHAQKEVETFQFKVEIFQITDLVVNMTKHVVHPKYEILNAAEKLEVMEKYKLKNKQFPLMLESDAIARYYGLEKGQIVKITYKAGKVGCLVTYRCVN